MIVASTSSCKLVLTSCLCLLVAFVAGCTQPPQIATPHIAATFGGKVLFFERVHDVNQDIQILSGDIKLVHTEDIWYALMGSGTFRYRRHEYFCDGEGLYREGKPLDLSRGGLIMRDDGSVERVNPHVFMPK